MLYHVSLNGSSCLDAGVLVVRRPAPPAPVRAFTEYTVPGRDGVLVSKVSRLEPIRINVEFNFMVGRPQEWGDAYRRFKRWADQTGRLEFSDDDGVYYKCYATQILTPARETHRIGAVEVSFRCDPYTYYKDGAVEQPIADITYNSGMIAHPDYHIVSNNAGTVFVYVNGQGAGIDTESVYEDIWIKTDTMQIVTDEGVALPNPIEFRSLYLPEGELEITSETDAGTATVTVVPNWRTI